MRLRVSVRRPRETVCYGAKGGGSGGRVGYGLACGSLRWTIGSVKPEPRTGRVEAGKAGATARANPCCKDAVSVQKPSRVSLAGSGTHSDSARQ